MADLRRRAAGYSDPRIGMAFESLSDAFAPPSAQEMYAAARAGSERQKATRLADLWNMRNGDRAQFDNALEASGLVTPNQSRWAVTTKDATDRRGQDITSGDNRYNVNSRDSTARRGQDIDDSRGRADFASRDATAITNNTADNRTRTDIAMIAPVAKDATQFIPQSVADMYPGTPVGPRTGVVAAQPGEKNYLPDGRVLEGNPKPRTEAEAKGAIIEGLTPEEQRAVGLSGIPNRPVYGTKGGTAVQDVVTNELRNTQTREALPPGTQATNLGAPQTTVNVGPNDEPVGNPPPNMAWARDPTTNKVKLDERGIPIALPIKHTPLADKADSAAAKAAAAAQSRATSGGIVTQDIDRAISAIDANPELTTGLGGQVTSVIGGSPASDLEGLLNSVRANVGFDRLQQMRNESPTGGALGQVSNREMELLTSTLGSLQQKQGPTQLKDNLKRIKDVTLDIVHGAGNGPARSGEQTATNRATGERQIYRGGAWVPHND